jgi:hypothetical protein
MTAMQNGAFFNKFLDVQKCSAIALMIQESKTSAGLEVLQGDHHA